MLQAFLSATMFCLVHEYGSQDNISMPSIIPSHFFIMYDVDIYD